MRGSVYYQTAQLAKVIFVEGIKKEERVNPKSKYYQCVSSYKTMETYRNVWNNFLNYLKEHWKIKNCELINAEHIKSYFEYKIEYYPSKQYAEKISSSLGKLEIALNKYSQMMHKTPKKYDFKIRQNILDKARDYKQVANNYKNRSYNNPLAVIDKLSIIKHKIATHIQLEGGARVEGVTLIHRRQLCGIKIDQISGNKKGVLITKEKGGKIGDILLEIDTYKKLETYLLSKAYFKIDYQKYSKDIRDAALLAGEKQMGSHGFRWNFAKNRVREYQKYGYTYEEAIQGVSWEMKHFRASITEHYLG